MTTAPDRNLALELVRTTEAAAMAASRWMGRGDKNAADHAAVEAMRAVLHSVSMNVLVSTKSFEYLARSKRRGDSTFSSGQEIAGHESRG